MAETSIADGLPTACTPTLDPGGLLLAARWNQPISHPLAAPTDPHEADGTGATALHWACHHGNLDTATQLLYAGCDLNITQQEGHTPLYLAVQGGHSSLVDLLLEQGAAPDLCSGPHGPPLVAAVDSKQLDMVRRLLAKGASPNAQGDTSPTRFPLLLSLSRGDVGIAEALLEAGAAGLCCMPAGDERTPLHFAVQQGASRVVELLLQQEEVHLNAKDAKGVTPLLQSILAANTKMVAQLLAARANPNVAAADHNTPLKAAAARGNAALVTQLVAAGARLDLASDKVLPLHAAAAAGQAAMVDMLLGMAGVGVNAGIASGFTALHAAARAGHSKVAQQLLAAGARVNVNAQGPSWPSSPLHEAARSGDQATIQVLLDAGADINALSDLGPPLHAAIAYGARRQVVQQLVGAGGDVMMLCDGCSTLHVAIAKHRGDLVELLLGLGASHTVAHPKWGAPLHMAVRERQLHIVKQLVAAGADVNVQRPEKRFSTPLLMAVYDGCVDMVELLLALGADPSLGNGDGFAPLHAALQRGNTQLAERLLEAGADVNAVSKKRGTSLSVAISKGHKAMVGRLLARGADPTLSNEEVASPLVAAVTASDRRLLQRLLTAPVLQAIRAGAASVPQAAGTVAAAISSAVGGGASDHNTAAAAAAAACDACKVVAVVGASLQHVSGHPAVAAATASPSTHTSSNSSSPGHKAMRDSMGPALLAAVAAGSVNMTTQLLQAGAPPNALDAQGAAPLHLAIAGGSAALVGALLKGGADPNLVSSTHGTALSMAAAGRNSGMVGLLLQAQAAVDQPDSGSGGDTPLHVALRQGDSSTVQLLLQAGASANLPDRNGLTPLHLAVASGCCACVEELWDQGAHPSVADSSSGDTLLHVAVRGGSSSMVELLLGAAANAAHLNARNRVGDTPLLLAVRHGLQLADIAEQLLGDGRADCSVLDTEGRRPLHHAALCGSRSIVEQLLQQGVQVSARDSQGLTPLHHAARSGHLAVVQKLVVAGAVVTAVGDDGSTPLLLAAERQHLEVASCLLANGAATSVLVANTAGDTALHLAAAGSNISILAELLSCEGVAVNMCGQPWTALHLAAAAGSVGCVQRLVEAGADRDALDEGGATPLQLAPLLRHLDLWPLLSMPGSGGDTPLHEAVRQDDVLTAQQLLLDGANVNQFDSNGCTPLHLALVARSTEMVMLLVRKGHADVNLSSSGNTSRMTPLQVAVASDFSSCMQMLLALSNNPYVVDSSTGDTLLHVAVKGGSSSVVDHLVSHPFEPANPNARNHAGDTPLLLAVRDRPEATGIALSLLGSYRHAAGNVSDAQGSSALHYAACHGSSRVVEGLLGCLALVSVTDSQGLTPLHLAARSGHLAVVKQLVEVQADVNAVGDDGSTPLLLAAEGQHQKVARWLLAHGAAASVSAVNAAGDTALHLAAAGGHTSMLAQLLRCQGVAVDVRGQQGRTALHLAAAAGHVVCVELLVAAGADRDAMDEGGATPLQLAPLSAYLELGPLLATPTNIRRQVDCALSAYVPAAVGYHGHPATALLVAVAAGSEDMTTQLLLAGAPPTALDPQQGPAPLHLAIAQGSAPLVKLLLQAGADPNLVSSKHGSPLNMAITAHSSGIVRLLLQGGAVADQLDSSGNTPLHLAARLGDVRAAQFLLAAGANANRLDSNGLAPLHLAVAAGSAVLVQVLARWGAEVNIRSSTFDTPLLAAVRAAREPDAPAASLEVVKALLQAGADTMISSMGWQHVAGLQAPTAAPALLGQAPDSPTAHSSSSSSSGDSHAGSEYGSDDDDMGLDDDSRARLALPLQLALDQQAHPLAELLLRYGASPHSYHSSRCGTLLHHAAIQSDLAAVELLLGAGAKVDAEHWSRSGWGPTPLLIAVEQGSAPVVERLLAAGADPNVQLGQPLTALEMAMMHARADLACMLLAAGADPNQGGGCHAGTPLQLALLQQVVPIMEQQEVPDLEQQQGVPATEQQQVPIMEQQEVSLVEQLLAAGAQPDAVSSGCTHRPLQLAVAAGCCRSVQLLLARGADPSVVDDDSGDTLLHVAVRGGSSRMVSMLLAATADVEHLNTRNHAGDTPLMLAVREGQEATGVAWQLLGDTRVRCDVMDAWATPLHHAAQSGSRNTVEQLLQRGADVSAKDNWDLTPLHQAAFKGRLAVAQQLLQQGGVVFAESVHGAGTPLHLAISGRHWEVVRWMLARAAAAGVLTGAAQDQGAIQAAASHAGGDEAQHAAPPQISSSNDLRECLHLAAAAGHVPTIASLLAAGVTPCAVNSRGELALHLAALGGHTKAAVQLIAAMAGPDLQLLNLARADGAAPVHLAAAGGHTSILAELLRCQGVVVDVVGEKGRTALHLAAAAGRVGCVELLVAAGADRDAFDEGGATPLQLARLERHPELVPLLATPNNISEVMNGITLLHTAAAGSQVDLVAALLAAGASLTAADSQGQSALEVVLRQDSSNLFLAVYRHLLGSQPTATLPLSQEVVVAAQVLLHMCGACVGLVLQTAMEVLGDAAAIDLWGQLVKQHGLKWPGMEQPPAKQQKPCGGLRQQQHSQQVPATSQLQVRLAARKQHEQQDSQQQQDQEEADKKKLSKDGQGQLGVLAVLQEHQQKQQEVWMAPCTVMGLLQDWLSARNNLTQQQLGLVAGLQEALQDSSKQQATQTAAAAHQQPKQAAAAAAGAGTEAAPCSTAAGGTAQWTFVPPSAIAAAAIAAAEAPGPVKQKALQELLNQLPPAAHAYGLAVALEAAAAGGHLQLCVLLLQQLAAEHGDADPQGASDGLLLQEGQSIMDGVLHRVVAGLEGAGTSVRSLGSGSLVLCGALLGAWQEVRRQQQQELVDAVVGAVGVLAS